LKAEFSASSILLVEDAPSTAAEIKGELEAKGYRVDTATGLPSTEQLRTNGCSLIILERLLLGFDSLSGLETWRKQGIKIPVLVVSELASGEEVARGLRSGADAYLPKPFELVELAARVEALLRRLADLATTKLVFDDLEIDLIKREAFRAGQILHLLPRELTLLEYFLRRPDQVITRNMLLEDLWPQKSAAESNIVETHICNLRKKIDDRDRPSRIANIRGLGFVLRKGS